MVIVVARVMVRCAGEGENEGKQGEGKKDIAGGDTGAPRIAGPGSWSGAGSGASGNNAREVYHRFGSNVFNND
jgi:hypothetical protein